MKITVETKYDVFGFTDVELPKGKTLDDIQSIWMKWGDGHIQFKDGTILENYFFDDQDNNQEYFKIPTELTFYERGE